MTNLILSILMAWPIWLPIVILLLYKNSNRTNNERKKIDYDAIPIDPEITKIDPEDYTPYPFNKDYSNKYQSRYLLTKNEYGEWKKLSKYTESQNLIICPKVRLLDIIEPKREEKHYKTLLYKVQSKHVDFVICDRNLHIKGIIELDDSSHDQRERKERDKFVDQILTSAGYKIIHTRSITEDTLDKFFQSEATKI